LILLAVVLTYLIISFWPGKAAGESAWETAIILGKECKMNPEVRLFFLVLLIGAFGSFVHAATSFVTYVGNKSFAPSWAWWYVLRPFIGMGIAAIFYLVLRGGLVLLSGPFDLKTINQYGIGAFAALSGLFSKQATDKLSDIFDNLFKTEKGKGDEKRADKLEEMRPVNDVMLGVNKVVFHKMAEKEEPKDVTIEKLYGYLKEGVTRIPILDHVGAAKYILHQSMLYKFISEKSMKTSGAPLNTATLTLQDLLDFANMRDLVEKSLGFVSAKATLGEAKAMMEKTKNCQDVFVTQSGRGDEPIIGWLPNTEISKHAKA
jgi:hypothetical protein